MSTTGPQPADSANTQGTQGTDALTHEAQTAELPTTEFPTRGDAETVQLWATGSADPAPNATPAPSLATANFASGSATSAAASAPSKAAPLPRRRVRVGTIVWGGVLLVIAALARIATLIDPSAYTPTFIIWSIVGFGGLLVIAGLVGAVVKAVTSRPDTGTTR